MAILPPIYNAEQLTIWPMIDEEREIYGEPLNFTKRLMSYDDSVTSATQTFYADGYPIIIDVDEDKGTLALGISGLTGVEFAKIFGISPEAVTVSGTEFKVINEATRFLFTAVLPSPLRPERQFTTSASGRKCVFRKLLSPFSRKQLPVHTAHPP